MKRLLYVTYYFPPIGGVPVVRALKFTKHLALLGWDITVLTVQGPFEEPADESLLAQIPEEVKVVRAREGFSIDWLYKKLKSAGDAAPAMETAQGKATGLRRFVENTLTFPDKKNFWYIGAVMAGTKLLRSAEIDVVMAQGYPWTALTAGARLARMGSKPFVADLRDAWTKNPKELWKTARHRAAERSVFDTASGVVFATGRMRDAYAAEYAEFAGKFHTITNGFDRDDLVFPEGFARLPRLEEKFVITYTGSLEDHVPPKPWHQSPYYFLEGLKSALDRDPEIAEDLLVNFVGNFGEANGALVKKLGLAGVVNVTGFVERARALDYQTASNVLLLIVNTARGSEQILTGKVFEYLAARKFILALAPKGEARDLIAETSSGLAVEPREPEEIAEAILSLYRRWKDKKEFIADAEDAVGDADAIEKYERGTLTRRLDEILSAAIGGPE